MSTVPARVVGWAGRRSWGCTALRCCSGLGRGLFTLRWWFWGGAFHRDRSGQLRVTGEASRYPVTSLWFGLGAGVYAGSVTWLDVEPDSFRPS